MRALVVGNGHDFDPGFVGHRLREHGYAFTELHREHPDRWPALADVDLILTLGSEWHAYEPATSEFVEAEAALVRNVVAQGRPLIAICFGAQVLSLALGGQVTRTPAPEIGWCEVEVKDPEVPASGPWMEWHDDVFTVPEGFDELATSGTGPQLIRSRRVLATQFHPEATESMIASWLSQGGAEQLRERGGDPDQLLAETRTQVVTSKTRAARLVDWFLASV
ncbi:MAG: type 1 glutamine amidotransferase [Ilumatobacteraceae bacterium]